MIPGAGLEAAVNEWLGYRVLRRPAENTAEYFLRRGGEWDAMVHTEGWGDFSASLDTMRKRLTEELIKGTGGPERDREKRSMLYILNSVLDLPIKVAEDAAKARAAVDKRNRLSA